jgi:hypothetical protein
LIYRNFGYTWETLPDSELSNMQQFFINNWFRTYEIFCPENHAVIMKMESAEAKQYQEFYNSKGERGRKMMRDYKAPENMYWMKE